MKLTFNCCNRHDYVSHPLSLVILCISYIKHVSLEPRAPPFDIEDENRHNTQNKQNERLNSLRLLM